MLAAKSHLAGLLNRILHYAGLELRRILAPAEPASTKFYDIDPWTTNIIRIVRPFTMTSDERVAALCNAVRYIVRSNIPGGIVECGVWRGGSMMAAALTLLDAGESSRKLHLFDTFDGMPPPTAADRAAKTGKLASVLLNEASKSSNIWAYAHIEDVRTNLTSTGYPTENLCFVKGKVEDTIPSAAPSQIAVLRLDTDWYESTKHELIHLFPRVSSGGVLIIDDYGFWEGARKAVDEYIDGNKIPILLNRIDDTGRIAVKR
jgi:O-methyltransferase